jgi:conjugal transfer pilus assembly protein TraU
MSAPRYADRYVTFAAVGVFLFLLTYGLAFAQTSTVGTDKMFCPDAKLWGSGLVTNTCWSCLFPMKLMGVAQFGTGYTPPGASERAICICNSSTPETKLGFTLGMWSPYTLIELVRKPYCSPSLTGTTIRKSFRLWGMVDGADGGTESNQFLNFHYFSYPLYQILQMVMESDCSSDGYTDFDLLYMSELDPTWKERLSIFTTPEAVVAATPVMQAACPVDCAASTVNKPINKMWWCAGCWGNLYPFEGNVPSGGSPPRVSSLLATRSIAALHRRGLARRTVGDEAVCGGKLYPMIPKEQYRLSMMFPIPESDSGKHSFTPSTNEPTGDEEIDDYTWIGKCCHNIGVPTFLWGEWRNIPAVGEDFVYMMWRWTDCCVR